MGADYYSMTCIGLKVPKEKIIVEVEEYRNLCYCNPQADPDDYPDAKYCPHCGRPIRRPTKTDKALYGSFANGYSNDGETEIMGWPVMYDTDAYNFYICIFTSGLVDRNKMLPMPDVSEEILAEFNADMRSVGLWDKDQFGLWTITYCSY